MTGRTRRDSAGAVASALVALSVSVTAALTSTALVTTPALGSVDTTPPIPFDLISDAGDYQTGYAVASPYNNIYVSWQASLDETSGVTYEVAVDGLVVRVVSDADGYDTITRRVEVPDGAHVVEIVAVDEADNRQPATHALDVVIDTVSPTFTSFPLLLLRRGQVTDEGYPMRYTWTGTDVGTGLSEVRIGPGPECCYTTSPLRTSFDFSIPPESSVAWRLWLYDGVGRTDYTVRDGYVSPVSWAQVHRSAGWRKQADDEAIDGAEWVSTAEGERLSVRIAGRSVAWVATTGPTRGRADVLLNGRVVDSVSLNSAKRQVGKVVWAGKLPLNATSTLAIVNRSKKERHTVGVDAILLQR